MAYRKQQEIIVGGSLNVSVPPDMVTPPDAICVQNFRVDARGALRSRNQARQVEGSISIGAGNTYVAQIVRVAASRYYVARDTVLPSAATTRVWRQTGAGGAVTDLFTADWSDTGTGIVGFQGSVWFMNRTARKRYTPAGAVQDWTTPTPSTAFAPTQGVGGSLVEAVEYEYFYTIMMDDYSEGDYLAITPLTITAGNGTVTLARPAVAAGPSSPSYWNVYRRGNGLSAPYRVNLEPITWATATFADTGEGYYSDAEVLRRGVEMALDHQAPPAGWGLAGPYNGRLIVWGASAYPNRIYWTPALTPHYFRMPDEPGGDWIDVGENDEVQAVTVHPGHIRIYLKRSVWRLRGDPGDGILERVNADMGLIGPYCICTAGGIDYFQAQEGVQFSNGDVTRKVSPKIDPLFRDAGVLYGGGTDPTTPMSADESYRALNSLAVKNGRLYFSYGTSTAGPDKNVVFDLEAGNWASDVYTVASSTRGYTALTFEGQHGELLGAVVSGVGPIIVNLDMSGEFLSGTPETRALKFITGYRDQGHRDRKKTYGELLVEHSVKRGTADVALTVKAKLDSGNTSDQALGSITVATTSGTGADRVISPFAINTRARNLAPLIEGDSAYETVIYSQTLTYWLEPPDRLRYDTGAIDLGLSQIKGFDLLWLDIETAADIVYTVLTDLPGSAMSSRQTATVTGTGRRPVEIPLISVEGRLVQVTITSASAFFQLWAARLRWRTNANLYLEQGKIWATGNIPLGI